MRFVFALSLSLSLVGCATTGGPFVTNVKSSGPGKLTVEKCTLSQNVWTGSMSLEQCQQTEVVVP